MGSDGVCTDSAGTCTGSDVVSGGAEGISADACAGSDEIDSAAASRAAVSVSDKAVSSEAALNNLLYFYSPPVIWLSSTVPVIACSSCDGCSTGAGFKIAAALAA